MARRDELAKWTIATLDYGDVRSCLLVSHLLKLIDLFSVCGRARWPTPRSSEVERLRCGASPLLITVLLQVGFEVAQIAFRRPL